ncbi:hypothetical protein ABPG75_010173 [Micractinium tetrahymenae]
MEAQQAAPAQPAASTAPPSPPLSIYRSAAGETAIRALYDQVLASLPFEHEERVVHTSSYGAVHVLVGAPGPFIMWMFGPLVASGKLRLYVPDLPYQAGSRSDDILLGSSTHEHGKWALEVLQALGLAPGVAGTTAAASGSVQGAAAASLPPRPPLHIGVSFGGAVVIDLANVAPEAIRGAALVVPGGLLPARLSSFLLRVVLPSLLWLAVPRDGTLRLALSGMCEEPEPLASWALIPLTWRHVARRPELPGGHGGFPRDQLARLAAPTFVVTAENDVFWPGKAAAAAAEAALPDVRTAVIPGARHMPARRKMEQANGWVLDFFAERGLLD